jgi:hypothetical protein
MKSNTNAISNEVTKCVNEIVNRVENNLKKQGIFIGESKDGSIPNKRRKSNKVRPR